MKKLILLVTIFAGCLAQAQKGSIDVKEVERVERVLAGDEMRGRRAGTPDIDRAADFIAAEFRKAGLQPMKGSSFLQDFIMVRPKMNELKLKVEGSDADVKQVVVVTTQASLELDEKSGYAVERITASTSLFERAMELAAQPRNTLVIVDTAFSRQFARLAFLKRQLFPSAHSTVFLLGTGVPREFKVKAEHSFTEVRFANVVGVLPGKSRKSEYVVFSGHYDHLGVGKPVGTDSIYNGANDDAAGTTAVIMLANYFKKLGGNERTLVFAAFTAEEIGGYGSQYFSRQLNPAEVMAMFNIEMIGTESKWGKNSAYITGFEMSSMGEILQKNLKGTAFAFYPDPYPDQQLFYRSDNATLARLGVPAHTISTSKMDSEPNYHKVSDEVGTLDLENMARVIQAIAESSRSIVSGKDTPTRVKKESLR
jgi:hypothetical protein